MINLLFAGTATVSWYCPCLSTIVEPLAARAMARVTVLTGFPKPPGAESDPFGETNRAPAGTGYAVAPTAGAPAAMRVPERSMTGGGSITVTEADGPGPADAACPGAVAKNGAVTIRLRVAAPTA
jgi:hypothetical protein